MPGKVKTLLIWLVVAFLIYVVVTNPDGAASFLRGVVDGIVNVFNGILDFFRSLSS